MFAEKSAISIKDTLKAFPDFKNKQKSAWSIVFWYVKNCIFCKCIQYTIHWHETQMWKIFPSDKINSTKNPLFLLAWAPTHRGFNLWFLYLKKKKTWWKNWYSFYCTRKDERVSRPWSHPVVLNMGHLDWKLPHKRFASLGLCMCDFLFSIQFPFY